MRFNQKSKLSIKPFFFTWIIIMVGAAIATIWNSLWWVGVIFLFGGLGFLNRSQSSRRET